ncbi:peroxidase 15-like [Punica granatum]|uniref:Peroxidase n=1 Tax=Punica granatum TaxID=22663 RepID=A0A6P8CRQ6_PUNGR|nr:peroxidase 15-like [Punica granatum]
MPAGTRTPLPLLNTNFYSSSCPNVSAIVRGVMEQAQQSDVQIGAKPIRLHFHGCFVQGCDGLESEQDANPNAGSVTGFEVADDIKAALENACPAVVSCADILAIASQVGVYRQGGSDWEVELGRRDSRTTNKAEANTALPSLFDNFDELTHSLSAMGLDSTDVVALSVAHTFGRAQCGTFSPCLYNFSGTGGPDPTLDSAFLNTLRQICPPSDDGDTMTDLDSSSPDSFDNNYFTNLQNNQGLLRTDQELTSGATDIVNWFAGSQSEFFDAFARSMVKMGSSRPLTGSSGEIRV